MITLRNLALFCITRGEITPREETRNAITAQVCGTLHLPQYLGVVLDDFPCNNVSVFWLNAWVELMIYRLRLCFATGPFFCLEEQQLPVVKHDLCGHVQTHSVAYGMGQRKLPSGVILCAGTHCLGYCTHPHI